MPGYRLLLSRQAHKFITGLNRRRARRVTQEIGDLRNYPFFVYMNRNYRHPPIITLKNNVTTTPPHRLEASLGKDLNEPLSLDGSKAHRREPL